MSEKTKVQEMSLEDALLEEHKIQTGAVEKLPDGRTIAQAQAASAKLQAEQDNAIAKKGAKWAAKADEKRGANLLQQTVEVRVSTSGAISARPAGEPIEEEKPPPESDIPGDMPGREHLIAGGVVLLENLVKLNKEDLTAIPNIGGATADKILAWRST